MDQIRPPPLDSRDPQTSPLRLYRPVTRRILFFFFDQNFMDSLAMLLPTHTPSSSGSAVGGYSLDGRISASDSLGNPVLPNENGGLGAENHDTYTVHMQQDTLDHYTTEGWRLPRLYSHATRVTSTSCLTIVDLGVQGVVESFALHRGAQGHHVARMAPGIS